MTIEIPETPEATAVVAMITEAADRYLLAHSYRTYLFGASLVNGSELDSEAAFIASMFHDIGLTNAFGGEKSFELVGADVAAGFLEGRGWAVDRIRLVEKAIVRHTDLEPDDSLECQIVQAGAALDVAGIPRSAVGTDAVNEIVSRYPRDGFVEGIKAAYFAEIAAQPDGVFANLEAAVELSKLMGQNSLDDPATT